MKSLSQVLDAVPPSVTLAVNDKAKALQAAGHDVISLAGGDPDFQTPSHIVEAAFAAIRAGHTHYPAPTKGLPHALEAIAQKMDEENGIQLNPRTDIIITPGSKWALFLALSAVLNAGDEVLLLEPAWVSYPAMVNITGGTPVPVTLPAATNFTITEALLRAKITPKTKAMIVNSPNNPSGRVLTQAELEAIGRVATENDLFVISDEVYEKIIFDGRKHVSPAVQPGMSERTLIINGLSKGYAMTGWRLGWLAGPTDVMKLAARMHSQTVTSAATFTMVAAVAALQGPQDVVQAMTQSYQERRDFMLDAIEEIPGIECRAPEGAIYMIPRFPHSERNSVELAEALLDEAGIAATPGAAFGNSTEGHVRFSIATAMDDLERAVERLARVAPRL
jgi:aspartate aminotransferase